MSSQKNVLEVILSSSRSVFNIQSLRMLMKTAIRPLLPCADVRGSRTDWGQG